MVITSLPVERGRSTLPDAPFRVSRWQPRVAGGKKSIQPSIQPSTQSSIQSSVALSALCHRLSHLSFQVPGDGHQGIGLSGIGNQPSATGSSIPLLVAEMLEPELPSPAAATRHLFFLTAYR